MNANRRDKMEIENKWLKSTLEIKDVRSIVTRLVEEERIDLTITDSEDIITKFHGEGVEHVIKLIHRVYQWSQEIDPHRMGSFLTAVVENDLDGAVGKADSVNVRALPIYIKYFYNYAPGQWRTQLSNR